MAAGEAIHTETIPGDTLVHQMLSQNHGALTAYPEMAASQCVLLLQLKNMDSSQGIVVRRMLSKLTHHVFLNVYRLLD